MVIIDQLKTENRNNKWHVINIEYSSHTGKLRTQVMLKK